MNYTNQLLDSKVSSSFKNNLWSANLADMKFASTYNKEIYMFCVLLKFIANMGWLLYWQIKK